VNTVRVDGRNYKNDGKETIFKISVANGVICCGTPKIGKVRQSVKKEKARGLNSGEFGMLKL